MRAMTLYDVAAVLAIEQAVQPFPWTGGNFADALESGYLCRVGVTESGEIFGYTILMATMDEAELLNIGVAKMQQHKGLGRAMLSEMLSMAYDSQIRRVFLEVRSSNIAAMALYRSVGFCEIGLRRAYYRNAEGYEDAVTMACEMMGETNA